MSRGSSKILIALGLLLPVHSLLAASATIQRITTRISGWLGLILPITIGLGLVYFIWGMGQFIAKAGDEGGREEGKRRMLWGIVGIFVMISIWGILSFLAGTTTVKPGGALEPPVLN